MSRDRGGKIGATARSYVSLHELKVYADITRVIYSSACVSKFILFMLSKQSRNRFVPPSLLKVDGLASVCTVYSFNSVPYRMRHSNCAIRISHFYVLMSPRRSIFEVVRLEMQ